MDDNEFQQLKEQVIELTNKYKDISDLMQNTFDDRIKYFNDTEQKIKKIYDMVNQHCDNVKEKQANIDKDSTDIREIKSQITSLNNNISKQAESITKYYNDIEQNKKQIEEKIASINNGIKENQNNIVAINAHIQQSEKLHNDADSLSNKIIPLYNNSVQWVDEIKKSYDVIYGYERKDDKGNIKKELGLYETLKTTYDKLENKAATLSDKIDQTISDNNNKVQNNLDKNEKKYKELYEKIEQLLPSALTTGLASAYSEKRESEEKILEQANNSFAKTIRYLSLCSLIPIVIGCIILIDGKNIYELISYMPKVVSLIAPLYIPLLWAAINFNKQAKLSKRLIEEYTHKEVINKTFEGLSRQAEQVDSDNAHELNIKLLYNII